MKLIKSVQSSFFACIASFLLLLAVIAIGAQTAQAAEYPLTGWAWSPNVGWISFNSSNSGAGGAAYGVKVNDAGVFSGYAWAPTVGWLSFNSTDTTGCGDTTLASCAPQLTFGTGRIAGWARFVNGIGRSDGWNGWVKLSDSQFFESPGYQGTQGVTYDNSKLSFSGYSWGSPATGWIKWDGDGSNGVKCPTCPLPTQACALETLPATTNVVPRSVTVNWYSNPGSTCTGTGFSTGGLAEGSTNITVNGDTQLSVSCTNSTNTASKQCFAFVDHQPPSTGGENPISVCTQGVNCPDDPNIPNYEMQATSGSMVAKSPETITIPTGSSVTLTATRTNPGSFASCDLSNSADLTGWGGTVALNSTQRNIAAGAVMVSRTVTPTQPTTQYQITCRDTSTNAANVQSVTVKLTPAVIIPADLDIQATYQSVTATDGQKITILNGQSITIGAVRRSGGTFSSCTLSNNRSTTGWNNITTLSDAQRNPGANQSMLSTNIIQGLGTTQYTITCRDAATGASVTETVTVAAQTTGVTTPVSVCTEGSNCPDDPNVPDYEFVATANGQTVRDNGILSIVSGTPVTLTLTKKNPGTYSACTLSNSINSTGWSGVTALSSTERNVAGGVTMLSRIVTPNQATTQYTVTCTDATTLVSDVQSVTVKIASVLIAPELDIQAVYQTAIAEDGDKITILNGQSVTLRAVRRSGGTFSSCTLSNNRSITGWNNITTLTDTQRNPGANQNMISTDIIQGLGTTQYTISCRDSVTGIFATETVTVAAQTTGVTTPATVCAEGVNCPDDPNVPNYEFVATANGQTARDGGVLSVVSGTTVALKLTKTNPGTYSACTLTNSVNATGWNGLTALSSAERNVAGGVVMLSQNVSPTQATIQYTVTCTDAATLVSDVQSVTVKVETILIPPDLDIQVSGISGTAYDGQTLTISNGQNITLKAMRRSQGSFAACTLSNNRSTTGWNNVTTLTDTQRNPGKDQTMFTTSFLQGTGSTQYSITCRDAATNVLVTEDVKVNALNPGVTDTPTSCVISGTCSLDDGSPATEIQAISAVMGMARNNQVLSVANGPITLQAIRRFDGEFSSCTLSNSQNGNGWNGTTSLTPAQRNPGANNTMISTTLSKPSVTTTYTISCNPTGTTNAPFVQSVTVKPTVLVTDTPDPICTQGVDCSTNDTSTTPDFKIQAVSVRGVAANNQTITVRDGDEFTLKSIRKGGGTFVTCTLSNTQNEVPGWGGKISLAPNEMNVAAESQMVAVTLTQNIRVATYSMTCSYNDPVTALQVIAPAQKVQVQVSNPTIEEI